MDALHVSTNITYIRVHVDRPGELNVRRLSQNENQLQMTEHHVLSGAYLVADNAGRVSGRSV